MSWDNNTISIQGCETLLEAQQECIKSALAFGWKEPNWFQEHIMGRKNYRKVWGLPKMDGDVPQPRVKP